MGRAPSLPEMDGERKTKTSPEERIREGDLSREILLEEFRRDPVRWRARHRDPEERERECI